VQSTINHGVAGIVAPADGATVERSTLRAVVEPTVILALACVWFFWGAGIGEYFKTEALRAIVVKEMLEPGHGVLPTVHGRLYLRKLPMYAWTTSAVARVVGRFDEQVARWPSAGMGVVFVMVMYAGAIWLVGPRAGPVAAVMAAANPVVLDYGMRADLDVGVLTTTSTAVVLLCWAWTKDGPARWVGLLGCYLIGLFGSFWKAPHVLLTVGLALIGFIWVVRRENRRSWWRFAFHPAQILGAAICLAAFAAWFLMISEASTASRAGGFVIGELIARVVPTSLSDVGKIAVSIPEGLAASFPACIFAVFLLDGEVRRGAETRVGPRLRLLLAWLIPTALFLLVAPSKAPRYWFLNTGAVTLLGTYVWHQYRSGGLPARAAAACHTTVRVLLTIGLAGGAALVVTGILMGAEVLNPGGVSRATGGVALTGAGAIAAVASLKCLKEIAGGRLSNVGATLLILVLLIKPIQALVYLPVRAASLTMRAEARRVDELVPPGQPIFVLSDKPGSDRAGEMPHLGLYCEHQLQWPRDVDEALARSGDQPCHLLVRQEAGKLVKDRFGLRVVVLAELDRRGKPFFLLRLLASNDGPSGTTRNGGS